MPLIEMRFPPPGHAAHAGLPGADQRPHLRDPAAARRAGRRGRQGGRRPDAGRPGDDPLHRRLRRRPRGPPLPHARGARRRLRRPLLRRRRGHHPRRTRLAEPADRVHRGAVPVPGRVALAGGRQRRSGAVPRRPRLREARSGCSRTATSCRSPTGRSWPAGASSGGKAGKPFQVTIDPGGPHEREVDALADAEPVRRRRGDPDPHHRWRRLGQPARARPGPRRPRRGLAQGLARGRARATTAWCSPGRWTTTRWRTTTAATAAERAGATGARRTSFFDRGPGYARLSGGAGARRGRRALSRAAHEPVRAPEAPTSAAVNSEMPDPPGPGISPNGVPLGGQRRQCAVTYRQRGCVMRESGF